MCEMHESSFHVKLIAMYSLAYVNTVAYSCWKTVMCKFELSQMDESGAEQADL